MADAPSPPPLITGDPPPAAPPSAEVMAGQAAAAQRVAAPSESFGLNLSNSLESALAKAAGMEAPAKPDAQPAPASTTHPDVAPSTGRVPESPPVPEPAPAEAQATPTTPKPKTPPTKEAKPPTPRLAELIGQSTKPTAGDNPSLDEVNVEVDALLSDQRLGEKTRQNFQHFKRITSELTQKVKDLEAKSKESAAVAAPAGLSDEEKALIEEAKMLRRERGLETDPEVKAKYDDVVAGHDEGILGVLTRAGASTADIEALRKMGGWRKLMEVNGDKAEEIMGKLSVSARTSILAKLAAIENLQEQKATYIRTEKGRASEYFTKKEQEAAKQKEADEQRKQQTTRTTEKWISDAYKIHPIFTPVEIPDEATAEEREILESNVKTQETIKGWVRKAFDNDPVITSHLVSYALDGLVANMNMKHIIAERDSWKNKFESMQRSLPSGGVRNGQRRENADGEPKGRKPEANRAPLDGLDDVMAQFAEQNN